MKNSHSHIKSVTGTVGSCKKPFQYVPITYDVCIVSMATALTSEYCSRTISPVDMTADWTFLTGVKRQRCPEENNRPSTAKQSNPHNLAECEVKQYPFLVFQVLRYFVSHHYRPFAEPAPSGTVSFDTCVIALLYVMPR